eukprot:TRINITY_DN17584_c0_g1_i1.p1 TRINITY_DN17584_c0_g1~~TRINITY_DN17584_c0_g1_i1.p1  ORF type:complete len:798 (+),score=111.71 TRINITY_DN17584_c0_g1_i1:40-2433(+)
MEFLTEMDGDAEEMDKLCYAEPKPEDAMQTDEWMYELRERELEKRRRYSTHEEMNAEEVEGAMARCRITSDEEERQISMRLASRRITPKQSTATLPSIIESTTSTNNKAQLVVPFEDPPDASTSPQLNIPTSPNYNLLVRSESLKDGSSSPKKVDNAFSQPGTVSSRKNSRTLKYLIASLFCVPQLILPIIDATTLGYITVACAALNLIVMFACYMLLRSELKLATANEGILYSLIPQDVVMDIHHGTQCIAVKHNSLTFSFTDLVGFTKMTAHLHYSNLVLGLNKLFILFDNLADKHRIMKVKTIGDCYMAVSGFRQQYTDHIKLMIDWCVDVVETLHDTSLPELKINERVNVRFGIASGEAVSGVLGATKPIYDFWGDTVNMASRMESLSKTNRINCTEQVAHHLEEKYNNEFDLMTDVFVKGKGMCNTYLLITKNSRRLSEIPKKELGKSEAVTQLENMQSKEAFTQNLACVITCVSELSSELNLENAVELVVNAVRKLIHCDRATLFMVDEENEQLWSFHNVNANGQKIRMPINKGVAGWSACKGEILTIQDAYEDPRFNKVVDIATGYRTKNLLCCPVKQGNRVLAVIQAINKLSGRFDEQDIALLSLLGGQAGIHLMFGQQTERIQELESRARVLNEVSRELNAAVRVEEIFRAVAIGARSFVQCSNATLYLMNETRAMLYTSTADGTVITVPLGEGVAGHVAVVGEMLNIKNTSVAQAAFSITNVSVKNVLCIPIKETVTGQLLGVVEAQNRCINDGNDLIAFSEDDEVALESYSTYVAVAIKYVKAKAS